MQQRVQRERRRFFRIPLKVPLCLETEAFGSVMDIIATDLSLYGIQIESDSPVSPNETVILRPGAEGLKTDYVAKGQIRWVKKEKGKFRSGIAFKNIVDWPFSISDLVKGLETELRHSFYFQYLLDSLDDGVLIFDSRLSIVDSNINQPFCLPRDPEKLKGKHLSEVCSLFKSSEREGSFKELIEKALADRKEVRVSAFPCDLPWLNNPDCHRYYNIWLLPLITPDGTKGLVLRTRDVTALRRLKDREKTREETLWQQYRYFNLGQLFDGLLEDIANPLSAITGRLDLMAQKMSDIETPPDKAQLKVWTSDIELIQTITGQMGGFVRAIARRRKRDTIGVTAPFSLNSLIEDELKTLDIHSFFKKIKKHLSLSPDLPPLQGYYSDWANAFLALCQVLMRQMSTLDNMEMSIQTFLEDEDLVLNISHNGKAINLSLDREPAFNILRLLKKKYGVNVYVSGDSGFQTVTLKMATSKMQEPPGDFIS
ncbi:MAG: PAS domain-containing protein [Thermodesulfobacteriota bacterium]|nr:PAS domain-containing protein [Thermodesulfobacteriota bacterium]